MLVKGIIKNIFNSGLDSEGVIRLNNRATVEVPVFASSIDGYPFEVTCTFMTVPGVADAYKEGDVVFVAFENNDLSMGVILGKLLLGTSTDRNNRGSVNCDAFEANQVTLPASTKIKVPGPLNSLLDGLGTDVDVGVSLELVLSLLTRFCGILGISSSNNAEEDPTPIPALPADSEDGDYTLKATRATDADSGKSSVVYSWVKSEQ